MLSHPKKWFTHLSFTLKPICSAISLAALMTACNTGTQPEPIQPSLNNPSIHTSLGEMKVGSIATITSSNANPNQEIQFDQLTGNESFILTTLSSTENTMSTFSLGNTQTNSKNLTHSFNPILEEDSTETVTEKFHEFLRSEEAQLKNTSSELPLRRSLTNASNTSLKVGDQIQVNVLNSLSSTAERTTITAEVQYTTPHFVALLDTSATNTLSREEIQSMIDPMEARIETEYAVFGSVSDVDGDGKVYVVYTPMLNRLGGSNAIVTGFFFAGDLYPGEIQGANGGEFIYCHVPDEKGTYGVSVPKDFYLSNTGINCLPHELQHAINYNMKVFKHDSNPDAGPFNEGQSHLAEDVMTNFTATSSENPSRVDLCLKSMPAFMQGTSLAQRGCSYLFYLYLYEQAENGRFGSKIANGRDFIYKIHDTPLNEFEAIASVSGEKIETLVADFFTALYLSNTGFTTDPRYNFSRINLRGKQDDNRGTVLNGPQVLEANQLPISTSVSGIGSSYIKIKGSVLLQEGGVLKVSFPTADPKAQMNLIRVE